MTVELTDIATHWARSPIQALADRGWICGYPDGRFVPNRHLSRAEFAALLAPRVPTAPQKQAAIAFPDVPDTHWAAAVIRWVTERGWFSGYPDGTFRPSEGVSRVQALVVLVNILGDRAAAAVTLPPRLLLGGLPALYFDDVADIPAYGLRATAIALPAGWVVNYPAVRQLHPNAPMTRGDVAALLCQVFDIPTTGLAPYQPQFQSLATMPPDQVLSLAELKANGILIWDIQQQLARFGLYDPRQGAPGRYTAALSEALTRFCRAVNLNTMSTLQFGPSFFTAVQTTEPLSLRLDVAGDRQAVYLDFLRQEAGYNATKLAILDRGVAASPYADQVDNFADRLKRAVPPNGALSQFATFQPYPKVGQRPWVNDTALTWLHPDIQQACLCLGRPGKGWEAAWLGRAATRPVECWSSTKILPILYVVNQANRRNPMQSVEAVYVRDRDRSKQASLMAIAHDIVSYDSQIGSSNALAHALKLFATETDLETWVKGITGTTNLSFRGRYGEPPTFSQPELVDAVTQQVILSAQAPAHGGSNTVSVYDLTRLITMVGWHIQLDPQTRLTSMQWHSLAPTIASFGVDSARYVDAAIAKLGLQDSLTDVVILSKLGFGRSRIRDRTELVYTAFVQFMAPSRQEERSALPYSLGFTLLAAKDLGDPDQEARELDARMATEVTEIFRQLLLRTGW